MTNREWLATLSDEDLAKWLTKKEDVIWENVNNNTYPMYKQPTPKLNTLLNDSNNSTEYLEKWLSEQHEQKRFIAHLIGFDTMEYGKVNKDIAVDSREEAKKWCDEHSYMGGYEWHIDHLTKNDGLKHYEEN